MGQTTSATAQEKEQQHQQQMPRTCGSENDLPCAAELIQRVVGKDAAELRRQQVELQVIIAGKAAERMISAYGQPAALSLALPPTEERTGAASYVRSNTGSSTDSKTGDSSESSSNSTRTVADIQVSPCGLFIAVLSPWGVLVYSNGQCRMLLGQCLVPQDSEVYGRLCCCCWASDSSALFVSADPLACVCVFSIGSSSTGSSGLVQLQLQELQQHSAGSTGKGAWGAAPSAEGHNEPLTAGAAAPAAAAETPAAGGESWLMEGFSTVIDTQLLGNTCAFSDGDAQDSEWEEEELQPAATENSCTAEEAIRSLPSMITAYRPPNTSPLSVSFCLLLRLPVRPSALCCSSVQRQQLLLLAGCSRQPALFWFHLGGLNQVLGCLYTSDLLRVVKRAGVCPGNAGPASAAFAASGIASTAEPRAAWSGAAYQNSTPTAAGGWGCSCSACGGRCCCFLERPSLRPMRYANNINSVSAKAEASAATGASAGAGALPPSPARCRCLGRRRLITYLFHPKGYTAVTELLRLPASAQETQLLPDLPDAFFCGESSQNPRGSLPRSVGSRSAPTSRSCSRMARKLRMFGTSYSGISAERSSQQPAQQSVAGADLHRRCAQLRKVGQLQPLSTSQRQLHEDALPSNDSSRMEKVSSSRHSNSTNVPTVTKAGASRNSSTTSLKDAGADPFSSRVAFGGAREVADSNLVGTASAALAAPAGDSISSSSGGASDDGGLLFGASKLCTGGPRSSRRLVLRERTRGEDGPVIRSLTDDALSDYESLRARCCGGVRQLQLNRRLDLLAVVTAAGELLLLAWRFPLRGYTHLDNFADIENPAKGAGAVQQLPKDHLVAHQHLQQLKPEVPISATAEIRTDIAGVPSSPSESCQLSGAAGSTSSVVRNHCRGCGSICIGASLDGRVAIGHVAIGHPTREGFASALSSPKIGHTSSDTTKRTRTLWRPLGLQLRAEAVCCCALNGERNLVAVGLGSGFVEVHRLIWPRNPVQRIRRARKAQQQQPQQRQTRCTHRNVERDGFTLLPQLLHVIPIPEDIKAAAGQQARTVSAHVVAGAASAMGPSYLQPQSVQSLQWTADGAALAVRWLRGGAAVFSHMGSVLFTLPDPFTGPLGVAASDADFAFPTNRKFGDPQHLQHRQNHLHARQGSANAAAIAAAVAAGAAAGSGQLCSWIMGGLSLLHVCPSRGTNARIQPGAESTVHGSSMLFYDAEPRVGDPTSEQLLEVPVVRSASVAVAASPVDVCGSRCASDLTDRVIIGGSHLLVWRFLGSMRASASLSLVPLPPSLYTAKAFPVRQAALSPDGAQILAAGSRGFALFAMLQRRWRLLCMERQEAQLPIGTLPVGWYTNDIFFVSTPAYNPYYAATPSAAAAAAPELRSTLDDPDAAPCWLLPPSMFHRFETAVAAAVDFCPSRFAAHVPLTIHEKTAWLQQQQQQYQQSASRLWGAAGTGGASRELSAIGTAAGSRGFASSSSSSTMWHYAVLFLSSSERLDLRCRVAEIKRLPARPHLTTVLPSLQQQPLLRPAASLGSSCCLCHRESNASGSCCVVCSGRAAFALRSFAAGNTKQPLLAIYDALGLLTAYQLQQPQSQQQQQQQLRQQDVVTLWQLDLSDFCDRPPQQIRFVGCAWLLLVLLQSGTLLLLRLGMPGTVHLPHQRIHRIPRLIVETFTVVAESVTGLWVGAEAQLQQQYLLPSSCVCILRPQQQHQRQQKPELAGRRVGDSAACCCSCLEQMTVPPPQHNRRSEREQETVHQYEPVSCGLRMLEEAALKQGTANNSDPDREPTLPDDKLNTCSAGSFSNSSRDAESAGVEQRKARSALPWPTPAKKAHGSSAISVAHASHSDDCSSNFAENAAVPPLFFVGPSRAPSSAAAPRSPLPFQRIVDFPRPAAVVPVVSKYRSSINLYESQPQTQQEREPKKHLMRERYAPLSLPLIAAERSQKASCAAQRTCKVSGSKVERADGQPATRIPEQPVQRRFQTFWLAGRSRLSKDIQKQPKADASFEAYAHGSSSVLLHSAHSEAAAQATVGARSFETVDTAAASSGGFAASTLRGDHSFADSEGCSGSGLDSSPALRGPVVAAQPWEARIENCDICCCCIAGWHLWAQTATGLLLSSVGFHYSGTAEEAAGPDFTPEQLLSVTDVRLRSALALPVEAGPQPLHIVGVIGELGVAVACTPSREASLGFPIEIQPATQIRLLLQPCTQALLQRQLLAAVACIPVNSRAEGLIKNFTSCTASTNSTESNQANCSSSKRLCVSVSALVRELLASAFAHHLLELTQFGLLMRCISTYLKAAKWRRLELRPHRNRVQPLLHPSAAIGVPYLGSIPWDGPEALAGSVRTAAVAALGNSSEGVALQWFLRLLQRKSPHVFVATVVFCMRKTEPLVSPAVLGSLLQRQVPPADPITLFTKCLEWGLLQTASLYLLPIQTAEGPLQAEDLLSSPLTGSTTGTAVGGSLCANPWLAHAPLELPLVDRLLAARVYQEVETTVAAAASALLQQHKWLRLFDFATTLGLDLPAWLRGHSKGDLLEPLDQPQRRSSKQHIHGTSGLAISLSGETVQEGTGSTSPTATVGVAPNAAHRVPLLFSEAVSSFSQQLCIGDTPVSLRLKKTFAHECSWSSVETRRKQGRPTWKDPLQAADSAAGAGRLSQVCTASPVPRPYSNRKRQEQSAAEIARYLANVLLLSGHPVYTLALATAVRDRNAVAQILSWYPQLQCILPSIFFTGWVDEAEGLMAFSRGRACPAQDGCASNC
ncbi:hypothetical protein, conserved [Eimeria praecox]|uniref:Ribosome control protein 1 domain-containing protein n=1 Tax=Eimeria praecox TaxID=51316 RepID=U6H3R3_9EIME|nr:hypothetical protein, conserved [Eimeria praecox]